MSIFFLCFGGRVSLIVSLSLSLSLSCRYKRAFLLSRDEIRIEIQLFLMENKASFLKTLLVTNVYHNSYICLMFWNLGLCGFPVYSLWD